ncbi:hypothetical protein GCM10010156_38520 [Planobispora rosea]|uniref:DNA-binding phage zinc finger domain-containing protein n=1 Tax=Planobispora rosea TaxID=35762 RepID=A0A8J3RXP8_PLARO|nr:hypothetical protein [Planobispora rosea]GGS75977.1 hypothetical protein GCM10010156_38520 [Planobispora rosea]GIH81927.1 hypothetical protein Pro02_03350 [Planobispora rosea]
MRGRPEAERHHLSCPVCGALPGTSCLQEGAEREKIHPSRRMPIAERNWRSATGWIPPELQSSP